MSVSKILFDTLSNETRFAGLSLEKAAARRSALAYARTFASREVFLPTYMPPAKMLGLYLRLRAQTLRGFFDSLRGGSVGAASFDMQKLPFHGAFLRKGGF